MARRRRRSPLWARVCLVAGIVLAVASGGTYAGTVALANHVNNSVSQGDLLGDGGGSKHGSTVTGPLDILLAGSDLRKDWKNTGEKPRTDTIMWLHIPATLDQAYLLSIPRDLEVDIPLNQKTGQGGYATKINAAFTFGMKDINDVTGGMQNLHATVKQLTGENFSMAAMVNWDGFKAITAELGGVTLCVDQTFTSTQPSLGGHTFQKGCRHYDADMALALVRERYAYGDSDYSRQRMQQQFIKQILKQATSSGTLKDPAKMDRVLKAAGKALTMDLNGYTVVDLALALRKITSDKLTTLQIAHQSAGDGNEALVQPVDDQLFKAMRDDDMDNFLLAHPELVSKGTGLGGGQ
ncbi:MAG TPA: LCP family protein [Actinocatenispora sp.]